MTDVLPNDVAIEDLPRLSFRQLTGRRYNCIDLERGIYQGPDGEFYRSLYRRPDADQA